MLNLEYQAILEVKQFLIDSGEVLHVPSCFQKCCYLNGALDFWIKNTKLEICDINPEVLKHIDELKTRISYNLADCEFKLLSLAEYYQLKVYSLSPLIINICRQRGINVCN